MFTHRKTFNVCVCVSVRVCVRVSLIKCVYACGFNKSPIHSVKRVFVPQPARRLLVSNVLYALKTEIMR